MASAGLGPNMILYLMGSYNLHLATATQILLISSAAGNFTPVVAAFIADSYIGRFLGVGIGSIISFLVILYSFLVYFLFFHSMILFLSFDLNMHIIKSNYGSKLYLN
jgi:hypothetical protein